MVDAIFALLIFLAFVVGFVSGQVFTALQFASRKAAAKVAVQKEQAKKSVDRLLELGKGL